MKILEEKYPYYKVAQKKGTLINILFVYNVESVADNVVKILTKSHPNDVNSDPKTKYYVIPSNSLL